MSNEIARRDEGSTPTPVEIRMDERRFPRLHTYSRESAQAEMQRIVTMAFMYRGQFADDNQVQFISASLLDELLGDRVYGARNLTFAEVERVVKRAVLGESELIGLSVASLYKVILEYVKGEGHQFQIEARRQLDAQKRKELASPMIQAYTGRFLQNNNDNLNKE